MSQLKTYYLDYTVVSGDQILDESPYKAQLLGKTVFNKIDKSKKLFKLF